MNEEKIKDHLARNPKKTSEVFLKIYNSFCGRCKQLCLSNPSRPMNEYCQKCQKMIEKEGDVLC
jgi:hypothetical protein